MKLNNSDLILYFLYLAEKSLPNNNQYTKENISQALQISGSTLNVYLSKLSTSNLIIRKKRHFENDFLKTVQLTEEGREIASDIDMDIGSVIFTPERHYIESCVNFQDVTKLLQDPLNKVFLLSIYFKRFKFDLFAYLSNLQIVNDDSKIYQLFKEQANISSEEEPNFITALYNMTLYGDISITQYPPSTKLSHNDVNALIILGETLMKKGEFKRSIQLYTFLLHPDQTLTQFQWFIVNIGKINVYNRMGDHEKVIKNISDLEKQTKDKIFLGYLKQLKAIEIGERGDFSESIKLFSSAIKSFHNFGYPLLLSIGYANRAYIYMLQNKIEYAEENWKTAKKYASQANSKYTEVKILANLADCEIEKGNFDTAKKYLDEAEQVFWSLKDVEGISMIAFNRGLYHLARKEFDEAIKQYNLFSTISKPLPGPYLLNLYRSDFIERAHKYGFKDVENYL